MCVRDARSSHHVFAEECVHVALGGLCELEGCSHVSIVCTQKAFDPDPRFVGFTVGHEDEGLSVPRPL